MKGHFKEAAKMARKHFMTVKDHGEYETLAQTHQIFPLENNFRGNTQKIFPPKNHQIILFKPFPCSQPYKSYENSKNSSKS